MTGSILEQLPAPQRALASHLTQAFQAAGYELYLVGGIVRDALLGLPAPADLDFTTSSPTASTHDLLTHAGAASTFAIGERFGTIGAIFGEAETRTQIEVTTFRRETYPDATRFPEVAFDASLEDDLARRDFTMNAIALNARSGEVHDPWGGEADIALATVRAVGEPAARFAEDPLRLLRAARFVAQLGFRLDWETEQAMAEEAASLTRISHERILAELTRLLTGAWADHGLDVLRRTGLLRVALPELGALADEADNDLTGRLGREKDLWDHTIRVVTQAPARPAVRWAAFLHDSAKPRTRSVDLAGEVHFFGHERAGADLARATLERLGADKALRHRVETLVELHGRPAAYDASWTDSAVRRLALEAGDAWEDLLDLAAADVTSGRERKRQEAARRVAGLRAHADRLAAEASLAELESPLDGNALMHLFAQPPGPWIKFLKEHLREAVIDGRLQPGDRVAAEAMAREWLGSGEARTSR